jgi:hypothetical protein
MTNFEIVSHYFELAADQLGMEHDLRAVLRSAYARCRFRYRFAV